MYSMTISSKTKIRQPPLKNSTAFEDTTEMSKKRHCAHIQNAVSLNVTTKETDTAHTENDCRQPG